MIHKLRIKNFQAIKDLELELKPFTVVVGKSDSGKSAAFRALNLLIANKRGHDFITHGEKTCTVEAELDQGRITLQRGKGTNDNFYEIDDGTEVKKFTKLSGTVPPEVSDFLKIQPEDLKYTFSSQFDNPFLLDSKEYGPSEVARILGALTNVNILFEGARESNKQKTALNSELKVRCSDLESLQQQLEEFEDIESALATLDRVDKTLQEANDKQTEISELERIIENIQSEESKIEKARSVVAGIVIPDIGDLEARGDLLERLTGYIAAYESAEAVIERTKRFSDIELPDISEVSKHATMLEVIEKLIIDIQLTEDEIVKHKERVLSLNETLTALDAEYHEALEQEGKCPTCGQTILK